MQRLIILALFLGSGMTGLIYQVVWTKLLTLVFGVTLMAVSTVLTSFFGGLALGSFLGGRWVDKYGNGFKWYGAAEMIIGLYALVFAFILGANNYVYVLLAQGTGAGFYGLSLIKFCLAAVILIIPTTLMGATLPILSRTLARSGNKIARDVGGLYTINTFGAIIGAIGSAFYLIPSFGMQSILYGVGVFNIILGAIAYFISTRPSGGDPAPETEAYYKDAKDDGSVSIPQGFATLVLIGFAVSGFTGLAYEVIWTRILGFILTGTIYAFSAVLAVFLLGIAAGSLVFSAFLDRIKSMNLVIIMLAVVEALIGLSSIGLISLYDMLPAFAFYRKIDSTPLWSESIYLYFYTCFVTLIIPTFLFGATFPLVCKIYGKKREGVGSKIGNIYSLNTVGGILGSFLAGFLFIPFIGMQNTIVLMGAVNIALGALILYYNPLSKGSLKFALLGATAVLSVIAVVTLPKNMPYSLHKSFLRGGEEILFYKEGAAATVMVAQKPNASLEASNKRLWVNGNMATAAYYDGLQINRFQGVLPMVLHPDPKDVLVICFGSGTTFGTLSQFPVNRVDNVEIASTVIEAAPNFKKENRDVLHNPVSKINIDDGRSFLAVTKKKFDVITEEPMHPSLVGVVNLYTKEYYELAKSHLKEDGLISQWIPLYNLSVEDVRLMVKTFQSVFPHTTIWYASGDIFMIGSPSKLSIDYERMMRGLTRPNIRELLTEIDLEDPVEFLTTFIMNEDQVRAYAQSADVMTDDMPVVEFTGPRSLNYNTISPNIAELLKYREPVAPYVTVAPDKDYSEFEKRLAIRFEAGMHNLIGRAYFADNNRFKAIEHFMEALRIDPTDKSSLHYKKNLAF